MNPLVTDADRLNAREHAQPHAYLGAHPDGDGAIVRAWRPAAASVSVVAGEGQARRARAGPPRGRVRGPPAKAKLPLAYRYEVDYGDGGTVAAEDPYRFLPTVGELDLHLVGEGRHEELWERLGAHVLRARRRARHGVRRLGAVRAVRLGGRRLQLLGRPRRTRCARSAPAASGSSSCPAWRPARATSSRSSRPDGEVRLKADPMAFEAELPPKTASVVHEPRHAWADEAWLRARRESEPLHGPDLDLRGPPRLVAAEPARGQPLADLPRAGRRARRLRARHGLHPHRADAGDGAPVQRLLGLPGDELLRAHAALRLARRLPRVRRPPARATASA